MVRVMDLQWTSVVLKTTRRLYDSNCLKWVLGNHEDFILESNRSPCNGFVAFGTGESIRKKGP